MSVLDPVIHQVTRLRILALLHRNREVSAARLREALDLTDGNLSAHAKKLEDAGYVATRHALAGLQFELRYRLTRAGADALLRYVSELDVLLAELRDTDPEASPASSADTVSRSP